MEKLLMAILCGYLLSLCITGEIGVLGKFICLFLSISLFLLIFLC